MVRVASDAAFDLVRRFEGLRLQAYPDPGTHGAPWTIGYGHIKNVKQGDVITEAQADDFLAEDMVTAAERVRLLCPVTTQNQFDALCDFVFNLGSQNLASSTLRKLHNNGDYRGAAAEFSRWNMANGHPLPGLGRRRAAEALLYRKVSLS